MSLSQQPYVFGTDRKRILIDFKIIQAHPVDKVSLNCIITSEHVKLECYNRSFYQNFFCSSDHSKPCVAILASSSFLSTLK